jgi:putative ABC transport system ATP-binding protein
MTTVDTNSDKPVVQAQGVGKTVQFEDQQIRILDDISLTIWPRTSVAIVGPSGSGKTTLLGLLAGLDRPSVGRIELIGSALENLNEDDRARLRRGRVGFVFQSFHLLPNLTALENVCLALEVMPGATSIADQAQQALNCVGLENRARHLPSQLSGGEQQRVALARAMVIKPELLFADEPTGNLDHNTRSQVAELLFSLCDELGCTLVLVTHDRELADRCDQQYRLDAGKLVS